MSPNPLSPVAKNKLVQVSGYPPRFPNLRFPYAVFPCFQKTWGANKVCPRDGPHPGWLYPEYLSRPKSAFEVGRMSGICRDARLKPWNSMVSRMGLLTPENAHQKSWRKHSFRVTWFFLGVEHQFMNRELLVKVPFIAESQFFWRFVDLLHLIGV